MVFRKNEPDGALLLLGAPRGTQAQVYVNLAVRLCHLFNVPMFSSFVASYSIEEDIVDH